MRYTDLSAFGKAFKRQFGMSPETGASPGPMRG